MITNCPNCKAVISVDKKGENICRKCGALILVGDPVKDEENSVIIKNPYSLDENSQNLSEEEHIVDSDRDEEEIDDDEDDQNEDEKELFTYKPQIEKKIFDKNIMEKTLTGVPWDNVNKLGFIEALYQTTKKLIFTPTLFFIDMKYVKETRFVPMYGIIFGILGSFFNVFWSLYFINNWLPLFADLIDPKVLEQIQVTPNQTEIFFQIVFSPIASIFITSFLLFLISMAMGSKTQLQHFLRLVGFSSFVDIFYAIPVAGLLIAFVWRMVLFLKGMKVINMFPTGKAVGALVLFVLLNFVFALPFLGAVG